MIKKGESSKDEKMLKKGKILKEIGEKSLNELQIDNPFAEPRSEDPRKGQ